jgi:hypothetical protein
MCNHLNLKILIHIFAVFSRYDYNYNERWKFRGTPRWPRRHTGVPRNTGYASLAYTIMVSITVDTRFTSFTRKLDFHWKVSGLNMNWILLLCFFCPHYTDIIGVGLLACNTVWTCRYIPTFQRNILPPSSALSPERWYLLYLQIHTALQSKRPISTCFAVRTLNLMYLHCYLWGRDA